MASILSPYEIYTEWNFEFNSSFYDGSVHVMKYIQNGILGDLTLYALICLIYEIYTEWNFEASPGETCERVLPDEIYTEWNFEEQCTL